MHLHENNLYGRKVFFLYPTIDFQNTVIEGLFKLEYEVYSIHELSQAKNLLRQYPDSICFINIDSELPSQQWLNFIHSFELDPVLSTIFLGIISSKNRDKDRELFFFNAIIPAGFISTVATYEELIATFVQILDLNGAKGRRNYIRIDCSTDRYSFVKFKFGSKSYGIRIKDISSGGFSVDIPARYGYRVKNDMFLRSCTLKLINKSFTEPATIVIIKPFSDKIHIVFLFLKAMAYKNKSIIRSYIRNRLNIKNTELLKGCIPDSYDYSVAPEIPGIQEDIFMLTLNEDFIEELPVVDEKALQFLQTSND
jgi:hypothetical protein